MTAGLIQIVNYGTQDIFLTGTPQITFFKIVYRRYTNFAIENIKIPFDNKVGFGQESVLTVPQIGDLIHKTFLEIKVSQVSIKRQSAISTTSTTELTNLKNDLIKIKKFMKLNMEAYRAAYNKYIPEDIETADELITQIITTFTTNDSSGTLQTEMQTIMQDYDLGNFKLISLNEYANNVVDTTNKDIVFNGIKSIVEQSTLIYKKFNKMIVEKETQVLNDTSPNLTFAWINKLGHFIFDYIDIEIGGSTIDRHYGYWINIWHELTANKEHEENYLEMIGDVSSMTTFDRTTKPEYMLRIPLNFWFCRFNGLALPLIALEQYDVRFRIKFNNLKNLCYIENEILAGVDEEDLYDIDDFQDDETIYIEANMYIDYIYLDKSERKKFAQSSHEYLIEQVQRIEVQNVTENKISTILKFYHPGKFIIWTAQREDRLINSDNYTKCQFDNYGINSDGSEMPFTSSMLMFNSQNRTLKLGSAYFNYLEPYEHFKNTPPDGINLYSFAIVPMEYQPSCSVNLGKITHTQLISTFDDKLINDPGSQSSSIHPMRCYYYYLNYNVLRFASGYAACAFTINC